MDKKDYNIGDVVTILHTSHVEAKYWFEKTTIKEVKKEAYYDQITDSMVDGYILEIDNGKYLWSSDNFI